MNAAAPQEVREKIVEFFVNLFKLQLGPMDLDEKETAFKRLPSDGFSHDYAYELQVKRSGEWKTRRMAISLLGESSASKSQCYKVVYDDILVVKIPPTPIKDLDEYIECINQERGIADEIHSLIECVTPSISALLKRIPRFYDKEGLPPEQLEQQYIQMLKRSLLLQEHLKMDKDFVFFMNLSKYSFFSHVIEKLHDIHAKVQDEIFSNFEALWDIDAFELTYGKENDAVFFNINDVCNQYERKINQLIEEYNLSASVSVYQRREWLLNHLADKKRIKDEKALPSDFITARNELLEKIIDRHWDAIEDYRETIIHFIRDKNFEQNKALYRGIIPNVLELLSRLLEKSVAMRDLKPDNIFIVGSPESSLNYLSSSSLYSLGLIDLETAVSFKNPEKMEQPQLAGTPSYATPSNIFDNEILTAVYDNLPRIFYLQDWFSGIGMIFRVVTGQKLFKNTSRFLPEIIQAKQIAAMKGHALSDVFLESNHLFWQSSHEEFNLRLEEHRKELQAVSFVVPPNPRKMMARELLKEKEALEKEINRHIQSKMFKSENSHQMLLKASRKAIHRYRVNWENNVNVPKTMPALRSRIIVFFKKLEELKNELEPLMKDLSRLLKERKPTVSTYHLLQILFHIVYKAMYKQPAGNTPTDGVNFSNDESNGDFAADVTTTIESTLK